VSSIHVPVLLVLWLEIALSCVATTLGILMGGCLGTPCRRDRLRSEQFVSYARKSPALTHIVRDTKFRYYVHTSPATSLCCEPD